MYMEIHGRTCYTLPWLWPILKPSHSFQTVYTYWRPYDEDTGSSIEQGVMTGCGWFVGL
ncbi:hypothetical protein TRIATDRAFT_297188 [Trichoderma atroviride IMI 206040]|uniref:Uncharacterized protein n=1 Tax=Hypocrea atroviridis (strain ATCC 20476 / IMI 206040) TaxID=452589 RepID=G9NGI4_HYPAI|nr:uncharacterized protein TRIATDRAFT_297188 [Trichoderma atroviride IMI 206040]EHK50395.1 hypothetical protein TRIATDRAFT_297188 [Trichoderma atroviride IMI 206040]